MGRFSAWLGRVFSASPADVTEQEESPATDAPVDEAVVRELRKYIAAKSRTPLAPDDVKIDVNLFEAGYLDSLSLIEFVVFVEKQLGARINEFELTANPTTNNVRAIAAKVSARRASA